METRVSVPEERKRGNNLPWIINVTTSGVKYPESVHKRLLDATKAAMTALTLVRKPLGQLHGYPVPNETRRTLHTQQTISCSPLAETCRTLGGINY